MSIENKIARKTRKEKYCIERDILINELNSIIGVAEGKKIFLPEIESNEELNKYLLDNIDSVKKYYSTHKWGYFSKSEIRGKGNIIGLVRSIYGDSDYEIASKLKTHTFNNVKKQYTQWEFRKINT